MHSLTQSKSPLLFYSLSASHRHTAQTAPSFFTLSASHRHTAQARKTQIGLVPFSLNVQSNSFIFYQQITKTTFHSTDAK